MLREGCKLFYSGGDGKSNGVGIVVQGELTKRVLEVDRFSDRVMRVRLEVGGHIANIISAYAPQVGCEVSVKEELWESLDSVMRKVPQQEKVYVRTYLTGHVGKGGGGSGDVVGGHGFGQRNDGGARRHSTWVS